MPGHSKLCHKCAGEDATGLNHVKIRTFKELSFEKKIQGKGKIKIRF